MIAGAPRALPAGWTLDAGAAGTWGALAELSTIAVLPYLLQWATIALNAIAGIAFGGSTGSAASRSPCSRTSAPTDIVLHVLSPLAGSAP